MMPPPPSPPSPPSPPPSPRVPCIGQSLSFDFTHAELAVSNLGGRGPDVGSPDGIRYVNVAKVVMPSGEASFFDLVVDAIGSYSPFDSGRNGLSGPFAQINFFANSCADLRVWEGLGIERMRRAAQESVGVSW